MGGSKMFGSFMPGVKSEREFHPDMVLYASVLTSGRQADSMMVP